MPAEMHCATAHRGAVPSAAEVHRGSATMAAAAPAEMHRGPTAAAVATTPSMPAATAAAAVPAAWFGEREGRNRNGEERGKRKTG